MSPLNGAHLNLIRIVTAVGHILETLSKHWRRRGGRHLEVNFPAL